MKISQQILELPEFPLHDAAKNNNLQQFESLLKIVDPNIQDKNERTALHWAARNGHTEIVKLLLKDNWMNPNIQDKNERTALHLAAENGHANVVELLLADGRIHPNIQDEYERTALHSAASRGHTEIVKLFLADDRIDLNVQANVSTALHLAAENGHANVVGLLLADNRIDRNAQDNYRNTALDVAIIKGDPKIITLFIEVGAFNDMSKADAQKAFLAIIKLNDNGFLANTNILTSVLVKMQKDLNLPALKIMMELSTNNDTYSENVKIRIENAMYDVRDAMERQTLLKKVADKIIQQERGNASDDNQKDIETLLKNSFDKFRKCLDSQESSDTDEEAIKDIIAKEIQDIIGQNDGGIIQKDHLIDIIGNIVESYLK